MLKLTLRINFEEQQSNLYLIGRGDADKEFIKSLPYESEFKGNTRIYPTRECYSNNVFASKVLNMMVDYKGRYADKQLLIDKDNGLIDVIYVWEE